MVILLNCVTLGMYQPCENIDCTSDRCQILQVCGFKYPHLNVFTLSCDVTRQVSLFRVRTVSKWKQLHFFSHTVYLELTHLQNIFIALQQIPIQMIQKCQQCHASVSANQSGRCACLELVGYVVKTASQDGETTFIHIN